MITAAPSARWRRGAPVAAALLLGLTGGVLAGACMKAEPGIPAWQRAHDRKNEITALWTQIRDWRREAGMDVEPADRSILEARPLSATSIRRANLCPDAPPPAACDDVCSLADAICDNAESICGIAAELAGDAWAKEKCDSAKASCREAKERCCGCDERP